MTFTEKLLRLAEDVISSSREHDWRIATAESCTGGLIMGCLTAVPG
ncbi:MAG TPA: damage-inducible protein CinA, partial [Rhodospirillales bacterium]|nr:damage-inducible protein CinA [Rhodospirillales bacterium]